MTALTLDALLETLTALRASTPRLGQATVAVPYDPGHTTIGGTPALPVTAAHAGIDWDMNKVLLALPQRVGVVDAELRRRLSQYEQAIGHVSLLIGRAEREGKPVNLAALRSHLDQLAARLRPISPTS